MVIAGAGDAPWRCRPGRRSASAGRTNCFASADLVVCGGGHGMLSEDALMAEVPVVVVPGGGDQWELANQVVAVGGWCGR